MDLHGCTKSKKFTKTDTPLFGTYVRIFGEYQVTIQRDPAWLSTFKGKVEVLKNGKFYSNNINTAIAIINGDI